VQKLALRYNAQGPAALGDRRLHNRGGQPLLSDDALAELAAALEHAPADGGLWSGPKVARWIAAKSGRPSVHPQRGWEYLRRLGYRRQTPRPQHEKAATPEQRAAFKKKLRETVAQIEAANPAASVEVWAFDEQRLGLKPTTRRLWARRGRRPIAPVHPRYQWLYLYGFVQPASGQVVWYLFNTVNAAAFEATLEAFAREVGAGPDKIVVLVLDNAGWHVCRRITPPDGVVLAFLPPYSPELQPAERLWPLTNEAVANRSFPSLAALNERLGERCRTLCDAARLVRSHTLFHWWPQTE
jgi:transposase